LSGPFIVRLEPVSGPGCKWTGLSYVPSFSRKSSILPDHHIPINPHSRSVASLPQKIPSSSHKMLPAMESGISSTTTRKMLSKEAFTG
jgi:hypothetical protein